MQSFNSIVDDFLDKLKPLADGKTEVPMADHVKEFTLDVVNKVMKINIHYVVPNHYLHYNRLCLELISIKFGPQSL